MKDIASFIALNRFGLGTRSGETEAVEAEPKGGIKQQIVHHQMVPAAFDSFPSVANLFRTG